VRHKRANPRRFAHHSRDAAAQIGFQTQLYDADVGVKEIASVEEAVLVPMRDGIHLSATIIRPDKRTADRRRTSTILIKSPYSALGELAVGPRKVLFSQLVRKGYALVVVNDRGTQCSEMNIIG
jgi:predicted acyl esterase